jgi:hypothetical protein
VKKVELENHFKKARLDNVNVPPQHPTAASDSNSSSSNSTLPQMLDNDTLFW